MIANTDEIVPVPFPFSHKEKRTILALVNDVKLQELAVEAGAEIALGQDVVKKASYFLLSLPYPGFCFQEFGIVCASRCSQSTRHISSN